LPRLDRQATEGTHLKSRFWMRVLITSRGWATEMEAMAPATEAMESCMKVASEYFSSCFGLLLV